MLLLLLLVVRRAGGRGDKGLEVCGLGLGEGRRWSTEWERSEDQKSLQSRFHSPSSKVEPKAIFSVCSFFARAAAPSCSIGRQLRREAPR